MKISFSVQINLTQRKEKYIPKILIHSNGCNFGNVTVINRNFSQFQYFEKKSNCLWQFSENLFFHSSEIM